MADRLDDSRSKAKAGELMTIRYVGIGGNDSNDGLSWANRKLTLNGVEDTPVEAGDTVYVGAGTYRDAMTCDVDGSSGSPITYIGDTDGSHTDGTGGIVRITGTASDELSYSTATLITCTKSYRTFKNLLVGQTTSHGFKVAGSYVIIENCIFTDVGTGKSYSPLYIEGTTNDAVTVRNCIFFKGLNHPTYDACINFTNGSVVNPDSGSIVENCIFIGGYRGVHIIRWGDITVKNCTFFRCNTGVHANISATIDIPINVINSLFYGCNTAIYSKVAGQMTEDYNNIDCCQTARGNVAAGANSTAIPTNFDYRWAMEMLQNGGSLVSPFDLASYSALINVAGTSPTPADMRGTTVQGAEREWGALEYDSTLDIEAGSGGGSGGAVSIQPLSGRLGL